MTRDVSHIWITEITDIIPQLQPKLSLLFPSCCLGLVLSPRSYEAVSALCLSFIRQMSPSEAMNNHRAPSVWLHPPGLVHSLLASVPCHGLAPAVCLPSTFFWAWLADALSLSGSVCLRLSLSFPNPDFFLPLLFLLSFSFFLSLCVLLTWTPQSNEQADYVREKEKTKKRGKGCSVNRGIRGEVIYLRLLASGLTVYPPSGVVFFLLPFSVFFGAYFHQAHSSSAQSVKGLNVFSLKNGRSRLFGR